MYGTFLSFKVRSRGISILLLLFFPKFFFGLRIIRNIFRFFPPTGYEIFKHPRDGSNVSKNVENVQCDDVIVYSISNPT